MATKKVTKNETPRMSAEFIMSMENCVDDLEYYSTKLRNLMGEAEEQLNDPKFNKDTKTVRQTMSVVVTEMFQLKCRVERTMAQIIDAYNTIRDLRDECKK